MLMLCKSYGNVMLNEALFTCVRSVQRMSRYVMLSACIMSISCALKVNFNKCILRNYCLKIKDINYVRKKAYSRFSIFSTDIIY